MSGAVPRSPSAPSNGDGFTIGKSESGGLGIGVGGQMSAAQRMMAKMGWKAGQGLGKQEQGNTTPLMARRTDRRAGVIVNASQSKPEKKVKSVSFNSSPHSHFVAQEHGGPWRVDDELEDEVASECAKYGTVTWVLIFEIAEPNFPTVWQLESLGSLRDRKKQPKRLLTLKAVSSGAGWLKPHSMMRRDSIRMSWLQ